ncbi:dihydrouridine synthase-domain-containing protein [Limtongia smithiae]|uniref:dihydrouridine synthase-domain-containing protein n=1 Tax=Limtongia smithiae TaxID=1125753 RepID=UPI0034CDE704
MTVASQQPVPTTKLTGRDLYKHMGSPKKIVAPMVDQSELAWRRLSRQLGADLCYTPMFHAKQFATVEKYRAQMFDALDGDKTADRPLVVQFCANDPETLLQAAKFVEDHCDAVDLNLGCPQNIAKKGKYGSFLQDDWDLIYKLINILHVNLSVPVTAKIRMFTSKERTLEYAKMILSAGAQILTVHGRTREMKGQQTGLADWSIIRYLRDNLPPDTVIFANGNLLYHEDISRCLEATGADAVMSAEGNLHNPALFCQPLSYSTSIPAHEDIDVLYPRLDILLRRYFNVLKDTPGEASRIAAKSHLFRILRPFLGIHIDVRAEVAALHKQSPIEDFATITEHVEKIVHNLLLDQNNRERDIVRRSHQPLDDSGAVYKDIPYWRAQPYFKPVSGQILYGGKRKLEESAEIPDNADKREKLQVVSTKQAASS